MRDIRSDLQERTILIEEQIRAAFAYFETAVQQLQSERDARVAGLQEMQAMMSKLIEFETSYMDNVVTLSPQAPRPSLADRMTG